MEKQVLDKGYVVLYSFHGDDNTPLVVARATKAGEIYGDERDDRLREYLFKNRHSTPFEFVSATFRIKAPLFVARQWMRHRTWSYNEMSFRYVDASNDLEFYFPELWRIPDPLNKQGSIVEATEDEIKTTILRDLCMASERAYKRLKSLDAANEMARMVLPQNVYTVFYAKANLKNILHFLSLRLDKSAQWEMRRYAEAVGDMLKTRLPKTMALFEKYGRL
jgi:thymidylate synthase (FAD)